MADGADEALRATASVCQGMGLPMTGLRVLRRSSYVVIRIEGTPYVARVGDKARTAAIHAREIAIARALATAGAPVARPAPVDDPLRVDGSWAVGLWLWVEEVDGGVPTAGDLGSVLRRIHDLGTAIDLIPLDLPAFPPPAQARRRLRRLCERGTLDSRTTDELAALIDALALSADGVGHGLVHGDFRAANVLATVADGPVVIDFDAACYGPLAWDLTLLAQQRRHFGLPAREWESFVDAYGGIPDPDAFARLCWLRDVASAVWALAVAVREPEFGPEARRRLASARNPDDHARWSWAGVPSARA